MLWTGICKHPVHENLLEEPKGYCENIHNNTLGRFNVDFISTIGFDGTAYNGDGMESMHVICSPFSPDSQNVLCLN